MNVVFGGQGTDVIASRWKIHVGGLLYRFFINVCCNGWGEVAEKATGWTMFDEPAVPVPCVSAFIVWVDRKRPKKEAFVVRGR